MKIARVLTPDAKIRYGVVQGETVCYLQSSIYRRWKETGEHASLREVRLLAPVEPANVLCLGRNYKAHAREGGDDIPKAPLLFIKTTSCIIAHEEPIVIPPTAPGHVDYEAELVVVIKKKARNVSEKEALDCALGYTCGNDVSARDCQTDDGQWARAKSFDTFGPIGPWIETDLDSGHLRIQGRLNGEVMQDDSTQSMIFSVPYVISYLSRVMTLQPGTVLFTGTPAGVGFARKPPVYLKAGDIFEVEIEGIGVLRNPVIEEKINRERE